MLSLISDGSKSSFKMPEKLQIVKPLEGSQTLHQWRRLATPHLGGVLEARPGIQTRGDVSSTSDTERETYSLSDYEEDDDYSLELGKCMEQTSGIYTYTMSKVMHPNHDYTKTSVGWSGTSSCVTTTSTSSVSYCKLSDQGTTTFSLSSGLACSLQERPDPSGATGGARYGNIVTETVSDATRSQTQVLYTSAGITTGTAMVSNANCAENAYVHLADKVKDIGLNAILGIANRSGIAPVELSAVDMGLNAIMGIRRCRGGPVNRGLAAAQPILYAKSSRVRRRQPVEVTATNSKVIMAAPCPTSSFVPSAASTPQKPQDDLDARTLPSLVMSPTSRDSPLYRNFPQKSPTRPTTLDLNQELNLICERNHITPCTEETGSGFMGQLSSLYTRTRGILGAPAAALGYNDTSG